MHPDHAVDGVPVDDARTGICSFLRDGDVAPVRN
jgi:hypothetical protein